jgi:N-succinyldiaminopimelate aminotransferase
MNPDLASLQPYPFQKLAELLRGVTPPADKSPIRLSVGEPQHAAPRVVLEAITAQLGSLSSYPSTKGLAELRGAIVAWATRRFGLERIKLDAERHVLPACGTREALFSIAQTVIDHRRHARPVIIMPNPFYQIYEGAALLAGAEPYFLDTVADNHYRMDFDAVPADIWERTQMVYLCSPGNPTGAVTSHADYARLIGLAQQYDFVIASDECYSEIYFEEANPPIGLLQVANDMGLEDYRHCLVFHSLSKRSNLPGLRSGFIAGDGELMAPYLQYRTYQGCTVPSLAQAASIQAWGDERHVEANRALYRSKFDAVLEILAPVLDVQKPDAGFYLWPRTPQDDETFTRELYARENVLVLPGSYLSRTTQRGNPGRQRIRMALVAPQEQCVDAAMRIRNYVESLS